MLKELRERLDRSPHKAITEESFWQLADDPLDVFSKTIVDMIMEEQRKIVDQYTRDMLCSVPKYTITEEEFNKIHPWFIKTNNEKEKEKMNAKKCERCGKLYELQDADNYINVYLPGLPVSDTEKENYTESRIKKDHTFTISIVKDWEKKVVDLCPECREKLKNFFETGKDDPMDVAVREINTVIKKAEE